MAYILHIETSTKNCSVSVGKDGKLISLCEEYFENYAHAEKLHLFVKWALEGAKISMNDLDAVSVSKGPGSYTGLRIGVSAAKGFCFALGIPLYAVDSLSILAQGIEEEYDLIIPMIDARRMEVYTTIFDSNQKIISPIEAKILDESSYAEFKEKSIIFCGDGAEKAAEILKLTNAKFYPNHHPSAKNMIATTWKKIQSKQFEDVAYFEPFYLKEFMIGK